MPMKPSPEDWWILNSGADAADYNLAFDEALLEAMPRLERPVLRFYAWTEPAASFGYFQKYADVERATRLRPLVRRPTGGGLVPHTADWTYSVVIPAGEPWYRLPATDSYRRIHGWIRDALAQLGVPAELAAGCLQDLPGQCFAGYEKFDVLWLGRKIAGAAQRRSRNGLLIQGSVQPPPISSLNNTDWQRAMRNVCEINSLVRCTDWQPDPELRARAVQLAQTKYSQPNYNRRR
jgi:lipoyl(octanoyl) transferase